MRASNHKIVMKVLTNLTNALDSKKINFYAIVRLLTCSLRLMRSHWHICGYISMNTVADFPLGSSHWKIHFREKNTLLSSLAFPFLWFKNNPCLSRSLCLGKDLADTISVPNGLSQQALLHRPKCVHLPLISVRIKALQRKAFCTSACGCERWGLNGGDCLQSLGSILRKHYYQCISTNYNLRKKNYLFKLLNKLTSII